MVFFSVAIFLDRCGKETPAYSTAMGLLGVGVSRMCVDAVHLGQVLTT